MYGVTEEDVVVFVDNLGASSVDLGIRIWVKTADYWDKLEAHNAWGDVSPTFGFNWDSTEHSTELTALSNALNNYRAALETGSVGSAKVDETLDSLNKALYDAGLQDVMDEKQAQLDKWLEEK